MNFSHRLRTVAATALLTVAASSAALAAASSSLAATNSHAQAPHAVQCRINFQASSLNLRIGQDLVLSWTAIGADKLTASWTTGFVPFIGAVTTTMSKAGTFSYQVTGTSNGLYCGGAGVEVKFAASAGAPTSVAPTPAPTGVSTTTKAAPSSTSPRNPAGGPSTTDNGGLTTGVSNGGGSVNTGGGSDINGGSNGNDNGNATNGGDAAVNGAGTRHDTGAGGTKKSGGGYPVQSPTSGAGVPWYEDPLNLLAISALALMSSLLLWRREQLRAVFVRRH